jgi:hypothetical protein
MQKTGPVQPVSDKFPLHPSPPHPSSFSLRPLPVLPLPPSSLSLYLPSPSILPLPPFSLSLHSLPVPSSPLRAKFAKCELPQTLYHIAPGKSKQITRI